MHLTREEERMLKGEYGEAMRIAMEIVVKVGEVLGADKLVDISHAHASGVSYGTIGEPGLHWLRELSSKGAKARVYSTVNPIGMDLDDPNKIPVGEQFYKKQMEVLQAFKDMGFEISVTCTPYYLRKPKPFERLSWGESSAVAFANSVLGSFTNREGGPLAVASAITGKTYHAGLQVLENRRTTHLIVHPELDDPVEWSALGYLVGEKVGSGIPRYPKPPQDEESMKLMLAASAASGGIALSVLEKVTPRGTYDIGDEERVEIDEKEIEELFRFNDPELIFHGCPHSNLNELKKINEIIKDKVSREFWIATSPKVFDEALREGIIQSLENKGIKVVKGTCSVVTPIERLGYKRIMTTSAKTYFYLNRKGLEVALVRVRDLWRVVT
ncbi:hypothetical protein IPA_09455 [Ignicoccus pacificus DSM 13166]|uniref:Phosphomevalonate dehydratase large subunit n=1 Tax=Ignicoccus pacificus DSM 13166 TaxID=940294 RepID=A0A977KA79_9CREN|nr:hypothetical protein IPA_09455 [Ignicoccus pacificus DSM 13166]